MQFTKHDLLHAKLLRHLIEEATFEKVDGKALVGFGAAAKWLELFTERVEMDLSSPVPAAPMPIEPEKPALEEDKPKKKRRSRKKKV